MKYQAFLSGLSLLASVPVGLAAKSFAGSNLYYAAGLADNKNPLRSDVQQARDVLLGGLQSAGVKVLRVWLDGQTTSNSKNTPIINFPGLEDRGPGQWDDTVLERLDDFMMEASKYGIKLHVSMMSYASLGGNWYGNGGSGGYFNDFYTNEDKKSTFKRRIAHVLQHVNRHTNKSWAQSSDHIFAFEAQNEAFNNEANPSAAKKQWQCDMAKAIKDGIGSRDILVSTGGSGYFDVSVFDEYFHCPSIDIVAVHAYGGDLEQGHLSRAVSKAQQNGKFVVIQEWGACYDNGPNEKCAAANGVADNGSRNKYISDHANVMNNAGVPWMYWQILPNEWKSGDWNYEVAINGPNWATLKNAGLAADNADSPFDFSKWLPGSGGGTNPPPPSTTTSSAGTGPTSSPPSGGNGFPHNTCKWGCEGWSCSSSSPCQSAYSCTGGYCKNCTWGCGGWNCSADQPCNADYSCVNGVCHHDGPATGK